MVAIVRGPSYYDPRRQPERALERRNLVLKVLAEQGVVKPDEAQRAPRRRSASPTPRAARPTISRRSSTWSAASCARTTRSRC
jgi:membrane peptidoglycan carboxypeptidase